MSRLSFEHFTNLRFPSGQHFKAKGCLAETCSRRQGPSEGSPDSCSRIRFIYFLDHLMSCADTFLKAKLGKTSRRQQAPLRRRELGRQSCARSSLNWPRSFQQARHVICDLDMTFCSPRLLQASHTKAEKKLQEERVALTRFDNELKELERVIKTKKQAASDAELRLKKFEHDMQTWRRRRRPQRTVLPIPRNSLIGCGTRASVLCFYCRFGFDGC